MANIVLKDKNGTPVDYSGITQIEVNGSSKTYKYTQMSHLKAYAVSQQTDGKYLVQKQLQYFPSDDIFYFGLYETDFNEFATESSSGAWLGLVLTLKSLTIGNTYSYAEMY